MDHMEEYRRKLKSADGLAAMVKDGWSLCIDEGPSLPPAILEALGRRGEAGLLRDIRLHGVLDLWPSAAYTCPQAITPVSWFSGKQFKAAVNRGEADIMPCYYRDMPALYREYIPVDAFMTVVSPMDENGWFSAGVSGSNSAALFGKAERIFLEVNEHMPRSLSAPRVHISQVTALCQHNRPLPVVPPARLDDISRAIGGYIAQEVPNGATIQLGIGAIPDAVGLALRDKRDLGIHTELLADSMMELIECGAVTNLEKPIHRGKTVATFASARSGFTGTYTTTPTWRYYRWTT